MFDEQKTHSTCDDSLPSLERQVELESAYEKNISKGKAPYDQVSIKTYGELLWILAERNWPLQRTMLRSTEYPNLQGASFVGGNFNGAYLRSLDLENAEFDYADLSNANLRFCKLSGSSFLSANLRGAQLERADLTNAGLNYANLSSANLEGATLIGANLSKAILDEETILDGVKFSSMSQFLDTKWKGVALTLIDWNEVPTIGQEYIAKYTPNPVDKNWKTHKRGWRIQFAYEAARAYQGLSVALKAQGLNSIASKYRYRQKLMERMALKAEHKYIPWLGYLLLDLVSGYGERPSRTFIAYLLVILGFAAAYFGIGQSWDSIHIIDAIIYSLTSFHGRGFFPGTNVTPHDPQVILAALEAVIGLFIELVLVATFTRRFLGD